MSIWYIHVTRICVYCVQCTLGLIQYNFIRKYKFSVLIYEPKLLLNNVPLQAVGTCKSSKLRTFYGILSILFEIINKDFRSEWLIYELYFWWNNGISLVTRKHERCVCVWINDNDDGDNWKQWVGSLAKRTHIRREKMR